MIFYTWNCLNDTNKKQIGVNMKPIRKNELEYLEKLIDKKFSNQSDSLRRKFDTEVDKTVEKTFKSFKSKLKVDEMIKQSEKARLDYETFKRTKEIKEAELKRNAEATADKVIEFLNNKSKINDWDLRIGRSYNNDMLDASDFDKEIKDACRTEARRYLEKQDVAKEFHALKDKKELAQNILYSGSSINSVVAELSKVFNGCKINYQIPKSLLQIEAPKE